MNGELSAWLLGATALVVVLFLGRELGRLSKGANKFHIVDLLLDPATEKASAVRFGFLTALGVTSLVVLYGAISRTLTDFMYNGYLAAFAGVLATKILGDAYVGKAAAMPDPPPVQIDKQVNMSAGDPPAPAPVAAKRR